MTTDEVKTELDNELDELRHMAALLASPAADVIVRAKGSDVFYVIEADYATLNFVTGSRDVTKPGDKQKTYRQLPSVRGDVTAHGYKVERIVGVSALSWYLRHGSDG